LQLPPPWNDTTRLRQIMDKLKAAAATSQQAGVVLRGLSSLIAPPEENRQQSAAMASFLARGRELATRRGAAKAELLMAQTALDALQQQVQAWVEQHPFCPTCGAPTRSETVLDAEHQHA
jgi:NADH pyrophosphatase NudC (nudix superfamily)